MKIRLVVGTLAVPILLGGFLLAGAPQGAVAQELDLEQLLTFEKIKENWTRRAQEGSLAAHYDVRVLKTFPNDGPQLVHPEPGMLLVYENTDNSGHFSRPPDRQNTNVSGRVVVIDAMTKEVIASNQMAPELAGPVHSTSVSPDGRWVYMNGPTIEEDHNAIHTLLKIDALTLQPVALLDVGTRIHHGQVWRDRYMLFETFSTAVNPNGLDVFLFDPETDTIVGGARKEDLGGVNYTAWTDPKQDFIWLPMQPAMAGDPADPTPSAHRASGLPRTTGLRWVPQPFWVAKINPLNWEVVAEFPYPATRSNWVQFTGDGQYFFIDSSTEDKIVKMDATTGEMVWGAGVGPGPYAIEVNADSTEAWTADKGEGVGTYGRTVSVVNIETGKPVATLLGAYKSDHINLDPTGKEMWLTSNGEGVVKVFDAATKEELAVIDMPGLGGAHGCVWVYYDNAGNGRVVADQADFHNGVDPRNGAPLDVGS